MEGIAGIKINLLRDLGGIGNISVYFLQPSAVKYRFDGLLSFTNWPRIHDCLQELINLAITKYIVLPGHLTIPLANLSKPKGLMKIELLEAKNLRGRSETDHGSNQMVYWIWRHIDPYVCMHTWC